MGAAFIGVGVAVLLALDSIGEMIPVISTIPIVFIVVGSVVFLIAFFGCCGAITQNRCFLILVIFILLNFMRNLSIGIRLKKTATTSEVPKTYYGIGAL